MSLTPRRVCQTVAVVWSRPSGDEGNARKGSRNARGIRCGFSEQRGNACVGVKSGRDPRRGQSVSSEVSGGVNGHDCRTRGLFPVISSPRPFFFFLFPFFAGVPSLTRPLAPSGRDSAWLPSCMPRKLGQGAIVSVRRRNHIQRILGEGWKELHVDMSGLLDDLGG